MNDGWLAWSARPVGQQRWRCLDPAKTYRDSITHSVPAPLVVTNSTAAQQVTGLGRLLFLRLPFANGEVLRRRV